ncbi:hypothetical protein JCM3765_005889 [Sporobolomyces pararoseus]
MSSFFGNRPSYVTASWANQRIYPRTEPTFVEPTPTPLRRSTSNQLPPTTPISRTRSSPASNSTTTTPAPVTQAPPPLYFPGANRQRSLSQSPEDSPSLPPNHIPSINSASTRLSIVPWEKHPIPLLTKDSSTGEKVKKWIRLPEVWASLKQEPEILWDGWPVEFGGKPFMSAAQRKRQEDEEEGETASRLSRFSSRRSATSRADSGIVLPRRNSTVPEGRQHPLEPLYRKRIAELNTLITQGTVLPRGWLSMVELMFMVWFAALIVALAQGKGVQTGFLKGVEIGLVCIIILSALAINGVRMRRWALAEQLRKRTRDWSPLPITSSTNTQLMRNYLDGEVEPREIAQQSYKDSPVLRWRLREIEGGYWLAYRPIIRCELITPATRSNPQMMINPVEDPAELQVGSTGDGEGVGVMGELPPGYEEDTSLARR